MRLRFVTLGLSLVLGAGLSIAQTPPATDNVPAPSAQAPAAPAPTPAPPASATPSASTPAPAPAEPAPASPAPQATPAPSPAAQAPSSSAPAPSTPAPAPAPIPASPAPATPTPAPTTGTRETLVPGPGDPTDVQEVILPAKPAVVLSGTSTWDDGFPTLKATFQKIEDELKKAGIVPTGRPLTIFVHTDDAGFKFDAIVPIAQVPEGKTDLTPAIKFGKTPEGKAYRFLHKDSYDEIDGTYETIAAYLDAKDIVAKDAFIEEYVTDLTTASDTNLEVNVYVQPK